MAKDKVYKVLISILITMSLIINLNKPTISFLENINHLNIILGIFAYIGIYTVINKRYTKEKHKKTLSFIAIIFSLVNLIAHYYNYYSTLTNLWFPWYQIVKNIIVFSGNAFATYYLISLALEYLRKTKDTSNKILKYIFEDHPIKSTIIILIIIYIPFLFISYPGNMSPDGFDEMKQFYGLNTWSVDYINLLDEDIYVNTHHSVFHTILIGAVNKIGNKIYSPNLGLFINVLIQVGLTIFVLSYTMNSLKKMKIPITIRLFVMLFYIFSGFIILPSTAIYKDVPFSLMVLLYTIMLMEIIVLNKLNTKDIVKLIITAFIMSSLTKKGIFAVIATTTCLFIYIKNKTNTKTVLATPILLFFILENTIYPSIGITPGSNREILAIPLQQISRVVKYHSDELTQKEKKIINEIIEYEKIESHYVEHSVDPIKNLLFKKDNTKNETNLFIKTYIKLFFEHPDTYINAFLNTTSGYFYINKTIGPGMYSTDKHRMTKPYITYTHKEWRIDLMSSIDKIYEIIQRIPIINLLYSLASYVWIVVIAFLYILFTKNKKHLIPIIPSMIIVLFLLVSPVNNNRRYIFPLFYSSPVIISYLSITKENDTKRSEV